MVIIDGNGFRKFKNGTVEWMGCKCLPRGKDGETGRESEEGEVRAAGVCWEPEGPGLFSGQRGQGLRCRGSKRRDRAVP